jgi:TonB dependent receptor/Carboxypeptidase regulatory-like domain/TonB-dependent Receptor Plug Domain
MNCTACMYACRKRLPLMSFAILLLFFNNVSAQTVKPGRLSGIIRDENNRPLSNASIMVEKMKKGTSTSVSGDYVLTLPPGTYTVLISAIGYETKSITEVVVKSNEQTDLSISMVLQSKSLGGVVVTSNARRESARGLLQAQKNNGSMTDGIAAEQMARLPVTNTAQLLGRISGLNVQSEKFVTIRGVSDRYNNVLINGSALPSTEPNRRNFSFDIVPSALVDNVVVNKTATPDLSGEFTGGIVMINTKDIPVKNFFQIAVGSGINTEAINGEFKTFKRDRRAIFGIVDEDRKWFGDGRLIDPNTYPQIRNDYFLGIDSTKARKSWSKIPNGWQLYNYRYTPTQNFQASGGINKRFENGKAIGLVAAITYLNEQFEESGEARTPTRNIFTTSVRSKYNTSIGGILNLAYKTKSHKFALKNLYNLRYTDQFDERVGLDYSVDYLQRLSEVVIVNKLIQTRLEAEHLITDRKIKIDWFTDFIQLTREQPNTRSLRVLAGRNYDLTNVTNPDLGGLFSSLLKEKRNNAAVNISFPFTVKEVKQLIKVGYNYSKRRADFDGAAFRIATVGAFSPESNPYYDIVTPENFANGNLELIASQIRSTESLGDSYEASQDLHALYAMVDLKFLKKFRITGGVRNENSLTRVNTVYYLYPATPPYLRIVDSTKKYREIDLMPSVNLIYSLTDKINIRGSFSKTIARPDFIERSPYIYYDFPEQLQVTGQQELSITRVKNYDLRFEYYPSGGEILSFSLFYKDFKDPVERILLLADNFGVQYRNMVSAFATGFEIDTRKTLEFINPNSRVLKYITVSSNFTYLKGGVLPRVFRRNTTPPYSDTSFTGVKTDRPIQGLAPYIFNAGISFQKPSWGLNLAFNRTGRKVVNGGYDDLLVQYENPRSILDFQLNGRIFKQQMELKLNLSDILNQPFIIYNNFLANPSDPLVVDVNNDPKGLAFNKELDYTAYKVKKGMGISFSISYRF